MTIPKNVSSPYNEAINKLETEYFEKLEKHRYPLADCLTGDEVTLIEFIGENGICFTPKQMYHVIKCDQCQALFKTQYQRYFKPHSPD